jgi:hypothetical protein
VGTRTRIATSRVGSKSVAPAFNRCVASRLILIPIGLGREYRGEVFPWQRQISGAIGQVLHYQSSLTRNVVELRAGVDGHLESDTLRCLVIAGNVGEQLNTDTKRRSFERQRESLHGVSVIGFDELFARAKEILKILTSAQ